MTDLFGSPAVLGIIGIAALLIAVVGAVAARYKVAGPNQAFIITGKGDDAAADQKVVLGGGVFVMPIVKQLHVMDLSSRRIQVTVSKAMTKQGVRLNLDAVAIIKVGGNVDSVRAASQRFLSQQAAIEVFTTDVLTGALRSIVGELTVAQITNERTEFATRVRAVVEETLTAQGLTLDTFEIQDVTDDGTYLADLARPEAAATRRAAEIAESEARRESEQARLKAEEEVAVAERTLALRQAEIKAETDRASAEAAAAGPLAEAAREQDILAEQEKVAERRAALTERELETTVRKPADAERYRTEQEAESKRVARIAAAEGERAATIANAEAQKEARLALAEAAAVEQERSGQAEKTRRALIAEAVRAEGEAEAAATQARGTAEAAATQARGEAEAAGMQAKAEAFANYNDAAMLQIVAELLPTMAREIASPMSAIDKMTVISTDGASQLPKQVTENLTQVLSMVGESTGLDIVGMLRETTRSKQIAATPVPAVEDTPAP